MLDILFTYFMIYVMMIGRSSQNLFKVGNTSYKSHKPSDMVKSIHLILNLQTDIIFPYYGSAENRTLIANEYLCIYL